VEIFFNRTCAMKKQRNYSHHFNIDAAQFHLANFLFWCALSTLHIMSPLFLQENVNSECYVTLLEKNLIPFL
jgi:hypothetical protein